MADSRDRPMVPSWDGSARTWRRYTKEVLWYVQGTASHRRRHCASQLLSRLTGPARLLAMSWNHGMLVDNNHGTKLFLQKLASNPLVRKSLPNAAAICQQYFAFRRNPQESIGNFLVRETLVHEEFCEAIIRLYEEKQGISQDQRDFGLPEPDEWDDQSWTDDSWAWWPWEEGDEADEGENDAAAPTATTPTGEGSPGMEPRGSTSPGARQGATGSSPSHAGERLSCTCW